ncbi:SCO family protein [Novosphingobium kunmingense]|nr:SCO family protein [Novosphingobium kunmingense]
MTKTWTAALFPVVLLVAACTPAGPTEADLQGVDIKGAPIGGAFTLTDKDGKTVRWSDFAGKYRIVYFGYTWCPDACPMDVGVLMKGFNAFAKSHPGRAAKVQPIFITVDPARDTPEKVGEFAAAFSPRLIGLTGTQAEIDAAVKAFKALALKGKEVPGGGYLMDHSRAAYLFDPQGAPLATLPIDKSADAVAADLAISVK